MPYILVDKPVDGEIEAAITSPALGELEMVGRGCKLEDVSGIIIKKVPSFKVSSDMIAYASPDSTYAVTKKLLDSAQRSVLIGIYDFTSAYMRDILINLMARGVKVSLMLDLDSQKEIDVFKKLGDLGAEVVPAPSCASDRVNYFSSSHEKVIVIDDEWVLVQSGNYSNNSIPLNEKDGGDPNNFVKGNRDMGIALRSASLARFFTKVLRSDMALELAGPESAPRAAAEMPMLVEAVPKIIPPKLFKSKQFKPSAEIKVTPVLSPDNYMKVVPAFLKSAKRSIYIEQQYIRSTQSDISTLLSSIASAVKSNGVDVKIILGKIFDKREIKKESDNLDNMEAKYGLEIGKNVRYINTHMFVHCHNKLIVVDDEKVLISSQNWSDSAVSKNREAGLILEYSDAAKYYSSIFKSDWQNAFTSLPDVGGEPEALSVAVTSAGGFIEVEPGDYVEV